MAYCCQCGVELDEHAEKCPLCNFEVPPALVKDRDKNRIYPRAVNAHTHQTDVIKNKILYAYSLVSLAVVLILLVLNSILQPEHKIFQYAMGCIVASILYVFLLLGYIKRLTRILMSLGLLTWLLCMFLDSIDGVFTWSILWAMPIIAVTTLVFVIVRILYRRGKHTNHFIFIPIYICLGLAVLLPLIELIIQYNLFDRFKLTWSLVSTISLVCFSGVVAGLYYQMPEYIKERLIRIFHV
ncbi:hypothetical protein KHM83_16295 [Fusibacter paucivorans]|uniref:Zinc ribbon domain-containing protein n=1 Tax=Fusibacter paucivorans TaxID=76009 RepID=A0ABS5PSV7_9FIRM|nr:DUF6320 domain-containing protein [Fusibacter paucivorans]MBS7528250.1 hypothetical protein [Fusibacter paucivorans]